MQLFGLTPLSVYPVLRFSLVFVLLVFGGSASSLSSDSAVQWLGPAPRSGSAVRNRLRCLLSDAYFNSSRSARPMSILSPPAEI